jgi:hypothetical protein
VEFLTCFALLKPTDRKNECTFSFSWGRIARSNHRACVHFLDGGGGDLAAFLVLALINLFGGIFGKNWTIRVAGENSERCRFKIVESRKSKGHLQTLGNRSFL